MTLPWLRGMGTSLNTYRAVRGASLPAHRRRHRPAPACPRAARVPIQLPMARNTSAGQRRHDDRQDIPGQHRSFPDIQRAHRLPHILYACAFCREMQQGNGITLSFQKLILLKTSCKLVRLQQGHLTHWSESRKTRMDRGMHALTCRRR